MYTRVSPSTTSITMANIRKKLIFPSIRSVSVLIFSVEAVTTITPSIFLSDCGS